MANEVVSPTVSSGDKGAFVTAVILDDEALASIGSMSDALALFGNAPVIDYSEFGHGFVLSKSDALVGVPFMIAKSFFNESEYEDEPFVTLYCVTEQGGKFIINDGSTGIRRQVIALAKRFGFSAAPKTQGPAPVLIPRGLTRSDYETTDAAGKPIKATTFYLST